MEKNRSITKVIHIEKPNTKCHEVMKMSVSYLQNDFDMGCFWDPYHTNNSVLSPTFFNVFLTNALKNIILFIE